MGTTNLLENRQYLNQSYWIDGKSTYQIAEEITASTSVKVYANKVRRALIKLGIPLKTKSEAQKTALNSGRHKHPTAGTVRPDSVKTKISDAMSGVWERMSNEEKKRRSKLAKEQWDSMSDAEKLALQKAAGDAVRLAGKDGSKLEKALCQILSKNGFVVKFHATNIIPNNKLEVDIYLPEIRTAIEIDGPAHFYPIWGAESLSKHLKADAEKEGLLVSNGFVLIRVKHLVKSTSQKHEREVGEQVLQIVNKIKEKFPAKSKRFIEIEVK